MDVNKLEVEIMREIEGIDQMVMGPVGVELGEEGPGQRHLTDMEFIDWFSWKVQENPYWYPMLPHVEGAGADLGRWRRIKTQLGLPKTLSDYA